MADLVMAKTSFIAGVGGQELDIRAGDLLEADHPVVLAHPDLFDAPKLRFPVARREKVEEATAAPGTRRNR